MDSRNQAIALGLMQMAMTYLEKADDKATSVMVQNAIDAALKSRPLSPDETLDAQAACLIAGMPLGD
jgi:hypothetical protein